MDQQGQLLRFQIKYQDQELILPMQFIKTIKVETDLVENNGKVWQDPEHLLHPINTIVMQKSQLSEKLPVTDLELQLGPKVQKLLEVLLVQEPIDFKESWELARLENH